MYEDPTAFCPCPIDPLANGFQLGLKRIDAVVADALDIQHLDPPLPLFRPQRSLSAMALPWYKMTGVWERCLRRMGVIVIVVEMRRRDQRAFPNRDDVRYTKRMQHIRIRGVVPDQRPSISPNSPITENTQAIKMVKKSTHKFPKYKNGSTRLGKLPSNRGSLNQLW